MERFDIVEEAIDRRRGRVAAIEPAFVTQPIKDTLGHMPLLAMAVFVFGQPLINLINV